MFPRFKDDGAIDHPATTKCQARSGGRAIKSPAAGSGGANDSFYY